MTDGTDSLRGDVVMQGPDGYSSEVSQLADREAELGPLCLGGHDGDAKP